MDDDIELDDDDDLAERDTEGSYVPTLEEIRQACAEIRAEWSEGESGRRGAYQRADDEQAAVSS